MRALLARQQFRFLVAGCFNTALDFLLLNVLTLAFGLPTLAANTISVLIGIGVSYTLQHFFVFRYPYRINLLKFLQFFAVTGFSSLVLQNVVIFLFEMLFDTKFGNSLLFLSDPAGNAILALNVAKASAVLTGLVWNFLFYKFVVFRVKAAPGGAGVVEAPETGGGPTPRVD